MLRKIHLDGPALNSVKIPLPLRLKFGCRCPARRIQFRIASLHHTHETNSLQSKHAMTTMTVYTTVAAAN